jgi:hypothetical protein
LTPAEPAGFHTQRKFITLGAMRPIHFLSRYLLALLLFNLTACSAMQAVSIENGMRYSPPPGVDYGTLVEIRTLDKQSAKFRVTEISPEGLGGKAGFYRYEDMKSLKAERSGGSQGNTVGYIIGALGIAALIALIANADDVRVCSPGPCPSPETQ